MTQWIDSFLAGYKVPYLLAQFGTILFLTLLGYIIVNLFDRRQKTLFKYIFDISLAFPTGLSVFIITGYTVLVAGIPYKSYVLGPIMLVILTALLVMSIRRKVLGIKSLNKVLLVGIVTVIAALALISVSGIIPISVSNDSLYYFWQYPRAICAYGGLRDQFDNFLTDTGLGAAVIGTLPFLFGFGETFGIQEFFHISFLVFFGASVAQTVKEKEQIDNKKACVIAILSTGLMAVVTSAYTLAHWAMSNMFFMELFFIGLYLTYYLVEIKDDSLITVFALILFACASIRMEGGIFILFLILSASVLGYSRKSIAKITLPIVILQTLFECKIFITYVIDNAYIFLTKGKAMVQFVAYVLILAYVFFIRDRLGSKIKKYIPGLIIIGLLLVNAALCLMDSVIYISNLKAFFGNLTGQSGWGILPYVFAGTLFIIVIWEIVILRGKRIGWEMFDITMNQAAYWLFTGVSFLLITLAVAFARGDALNVNTGDSGNRVLLQITPLLLMTVILWLVDLTTYDE